MHCIKNQKGQSVIEYMILTALIAVASIGVLSVFGQNIQVKIAQLTKEIRGDGATAESLKGEYKDIEEKHYRQRNLGTFFQGNH